MAISVRKKGVLFSFVFMAAEMLSSIFFTPFLIRNFGQAEYGIYSLVAAITSYLALLDFGVGNSIVRYMAKFRALDDQKSQRSLLAVTVSFYMVVSVVVILLGIILNNNMEFIFGKGLNESQILRAKQMFSITMLNMAVTLMLSPFNNTMIAFEKFAFNKLLLTVKIIVRVSISMIVLIMGGKGVAIVLVNFLLTASFGIISILYVIIKLHIVPNFKGINFAFIKEIIGYTSFVFIQMIATQINNMTDQVLIGAMVKSSATILGVYAIGAQINTYFQGIAGSITGVLMPGIVGMVERGATSKELLYEMVHIGRLLFVFLGIIWGVFMVVGDVFIVLWAGEENIKAYYVACILITPMLITLVQIVGSQILWAKNKHKVQANLKISVAVLNVFLTVILIQWNPLIGASLGTAIAIILGNVVVMNIVFAKDIGISMKEYYKGLLKGILPCLFISMFVGIVIRNITHINSWGGFFLCSSIIVGIYCVMLYTFGINQYEKRLFSIPANKILNKFKRSN